MDKIIVPMSYMGSGSSAVTDLLKEYEGNQLITDDVIDSGSTITYKFNKINNKWYFKESIIK